MKTQWEDINQGVGSYWTLNLLEPWSWTHQPADLQEIKFCYLSHPVCFLCLFVCFLNRSLVNFQMFKLVFEKEEEPDIKMPITAGSLKKQESSRKTHISALLTMPKPLTVWITKNCGKFWQRWEYQTTWPASWETHVQIRKQQLELDMEQQTGSK